MKKLHLLLKLKTFANQIKALNFISYKKIEKRENEVGE